MCKSNLHFTQKTTIEISKLATKFETYSHGEEIINGDIKE